MPTYAYRGDECGHEFEVRQSFSEDPITECVTCGKPVHRVIQPAGIVFKGTGWYLTDSRPTTESSGGVQDAGKASTGDNGSNDTAKSAESSTATSKAEPAAAASASTES